MYNRGMRIFWGGFAIGAIVSSIICIASYPRNNNNNWIPHKVENGAKRFVTNAGNILNNISKLLS